MTGHPQSSAAASIIDPGTIQAYRETEYRVLGGQPFTLRVGKVCADLLAAHKLHQVDGSAFLTACNPFSQRSGDAANANRQAELAAELTRRGLTFAPGIGQHPSNDWPGEDGSLVFGLDLEAAKALGARFEQNALIWSGADGVPQLILLR
ncbi:MAG: DUF3293 domain-containing protein [Burkholderiales bacterium]|uniref:DUF3293 domain-containing protein n=1 Tax=Ottowia pentelensis TaxID=511108 RepID=A0ABV6PNF6_9BURK|nr:DUF3293 domain-containing protein [Ottowia sp.]MBN9404712.1 DUF3293 domain-containing protein [Burkholderiales bacterium]MBS0403753.1 DUF3293 domain-containing protein [Pseudomonadota bacterium]MBS0415376.1 DUF3293 domain-containing protein [Pseudomonadota bacterium]